MKIMIISKTPDKKSIDIKTSYTAADSISLCKGAVKIICRMVESGGYVYIGLYHKYGREPFLDLFKECRDKLFEGREITEREINDAFKIFKGLNKRLFTEYGASLSNYQ